jgi:hypothetical protein
MVSPTGYRVRWGASTGNPTPVYIVQTAPAETGPWSVGNRTETALLFQDVTGRTPGSTDFVRVQARNIGGTAFSNVVSVPLPPAIIVTRDFVLPLEWQSPLIESAEGTSLTSTTGRIVDAIGTIWTLVSGTGLELRRSGVSVGAPTNLVEVYYTGHRVWFGTSAYWFYWSNEVIAASNPHTVLPAESPDRTALTSTTGTVTDSTGVTWQLVSGTGLQAQRNAFLTDTRLTNLTSLNYIGHQVYVHNATGWFVWGSTLRTWTATSDPYSEPDPGALSGRHRQHHGYIWGCMDISKCQQR